MSSTPYADALAAMSDAEIIEALGRTRSQARHECDQCDAFTPNAVTGGQLLCDACRDSGSGPEVHVDWRMTPQEWEELRHILVRSRYSSRYLTRLWAEGKLGGMT